MSEQKKIYWKGLEQLRNDESFVQHAHQEFSNDESDPGHSRRDFLRMMGFGISAATLAACETPVRKAIPYVNKPVDVDASIPNYYASTYLNGGDYCSIVVKTREGRPIKIEGNTLSTVTRGGVNAQVEASVLSLYDDYRLRKPKIGDKAVTWEEVDKEVIGKLDAVAAAGGQIDLVSNTIISPSTFSAISKFTTKYGTARHIQYDAVSSFGVLKANEESFGVAMIPSYDFSKAKVIVGIACDFLGSWHGAIETASQYASTRKLDDGKTEMSRHYQFESNLSLTGANADYRTAIRSSQEGAVAVQLYNLVAQKLGAATVSGGNEKYAHLENAANDLVASKGASVVVAGSNDKNVQVVVNAINALLGNYGSTINTERPTLVRKGNDEQMASFVADLESGKTKAVIFYNCNPVYDHPEGDKIAKSLVKATLSVSTASAEDESAILCGVKAPDHHFLESWNDAEPRKGSFSLGQPAITPIFITRQGQESLLKWSGIEKPDYFSFVKSNWKSWFYNNSGTSDFQIFWDKCLYDGVYETSVSASSLKYAGNTANAASALSSSAASGLEVVLYQSFGVGTGSQANNPLLHELPDPITKVVWDHVLTISVKDAAALGFTNDGESNTQLAELTVGSFKASIPVLIQPGQAVGTIGISVGYGRTKVGRVAENLGTNVYPLMKMVNGSLSRSVLSGVKLTNTNASYQIAQTQTHNTYMGRDSVIQESVLARFQKDPKAGRYEPAISKWDEKVAPGTLSLWKGHDYNDHHWAMAVDLNSCTGCGSCIVACNVENNVAMVGKDEVIRRREMHWLRIDRYYSSDANIDDLRGLEVASENPEVVFQPMMCQHCNNAPCETVCPVAATTHSTEGLNQMTYNRCIGTRYCANNCPYKVRRFNWFKYHDNQKFFEVNPAMNTDLGRMVLNPDVTVRSRGVMEKCSFCVQRIQSAKLTSKKERRTMKDGDVVTACQASCASGAIVFGDINDPESRISKLLQVEKNPERPNGIDKNIGNPRAYTVLEEVGVKPNVFYLTKIRNKEEAKA